MAAAAEIVIVTSHFNEDLAWLTHSPYKVFLCDKVGANHIDNNIKSQFYCDPVIPNKGHEASTYLSFIINHYNFLPPYIAFIHGHEDAWHQKHPLGILGAIRTAKKESFDYISLNVKGHPEAGGVYDVENPEEHNVNAFALIRKNWDTLFRPYCNIELPRFLFHDSCAQFLVSRENILRHPIDAYKKWFDFVITHDPTKDTATAFEFIWHVIFGEEPVCTERDEEYLRSRFNAI